VPATLFVLAVILLLNPLPYRDAIPEPVRVPSWATDTTPVRQPDRQPDYQFAVFTYQCNDCHAIIPPPATDTYRTPTQHQEIVLEHGINGSCFNCRHRTDRNALAGDREERIRWDQPQLVCAKCHGPVYRDWQHGSHGRTNGHWDTSRGEAVRRKCIECHDPHRPPFPSMRPAPGPNTLRMGPQDAEPHAEQGNPLRLGGQLRPVESRRSPPCSQTEQGH
jgi:hypothetical protein